MIAEKMGQPDAQKQVAVMAAKMVICVSEATRQAALDYYRIAPDKLRVVHHGYSPIFRPTHEKRQTFLLYVGSRAAHKNFMGFLSAYRALPHRMPLVVVGQPWNRAEKRAIQGLAVQLVTDANDTTLCQLYNQAYALVYPSIDEGFGIPLLEALACGCAVIASRIPSTVEVVGDCPFYMDAETSL